jgi:hypothetical protein
LSGVEDGVVVHELLVHEVLGAGEAVADALEALRERVLRVGPLRQALERALHELLRFRLLAAQG